MSLARTLSRYSGAHRGAGAGRDAPPAHEACELCRAAIGERHSHLVDLDQRRLCCACRPCALLFEKPGAAQGRYRTVPERVLSGDPKGLSATEWDSVQLPVKLAFFFFNSRLKRWVAHYPSPAGATESELPLEAWEKLREEHPLVAAAEPDVEAILTYAERHGPTDAALEAFLVPIDVCYALVGLIRGQWRGFDGGPARDAVKSFFSQLRQRSRPFAAELGAGGAR